MSGPLPSESKPEIPDILALRYASTAMCAIWSPEGKVRLEREFWIAVMRVQQSLGVAIPEAAIAAYEQVRSQVDLASIAERERILRHDVKARIEEFCALAGHEYVHMGLTSRDLTDNVEQLQVLRSLDLLRTKAVAVLLRMADWASRTRSLLLVARTHNVPAQPTTVGKRLAMFGEELLQSLQRLDHLAETYPVRGLQGAVGTQLDQWQLLGDGEKVQQLTEQIRTHLKCPASLNAVGQVYPRSLDAEAVQALFTLSAPLSSLAKTLRLMAGQGLASEGFRKGQVGSSAMPHKMNTRTCERIGGFHQILNGFANMLMGLSGDQWNEGDVACSVVRRVALPGAFFAADGQLEAALTVLEEMGFYEAAIQAEVERELPFLATTALLMEAVQRGSGREAAHEVIKEHAVATAQELRDGVRANNNLPERLASDKRLPLALEDIREVLDDPERFVGSAPQQVDAFGEKVRKWQE
ncbi:MAG TPA: adenylosuccinate lyase, partial [Deltaproteobacteria bacterium]|nr:adenylosuccinate lyase [Deltaproteobacteria bacterium]